MYTTLTILDYTAELIELTFELGALTRKYAVPAMVAIYVAVVMTIEFIRGQKGPTRFQLIQKVTRQWERISALDTTLGETDSLELTWYLESLSDEELLLECQRL